MELRNLITFQKIMELGSFSAAADALGYSQSAVTMQMKQLESELSTKLFDRIGRSILPTEEGQRLSKYASSILRKVDNAIADLSSERTPKGKVTLGILESICTAYLPEILSRYHKIYPDVTTSIVTGTFSELSALLNSGQIDLLWIYDPLYETEHWVRAFSYESPVFIVAAPSHRLATAKSIPLSALQNEPLILTETDCSYRNAFTTRLASAGQPLNLFLEIGNTEIIKRFVAAGLGISALPGYTIAEEQKSHTLIPLSVSDFDITMYGQLFYHKDKWLSPAIKSLIGLIRESF